MLASQGPALNADLVSSLPRHSSCTWPARQFCVLPADRRFYTVAKRSPQVLHTLWLSLGQ